MRRSPSLAVRGRAAVAALGTVAALAVAARPAEAGQAITAKTVSNGGIAVTAKYDAGAVKFNVDTLAGNFTTTFVSASGYGPANSAFTTYCVDIATTLNSGTQVVADVSVTSAGAMVDAKGVARNIGAAGWIFNAFATQSLAQLASFSGLATLTQAQADAAIQMAIWEAAYDPNGGKAAGPKAYLGYLGAGTLTFTGTAVDKNTNLNVITLANLMLDARGGQTAAIGLVDYPPIVGGALSPANQDQLFAAPVPEPSTLAMAAVGGLIGLVGLARGRLNARRRP